MSDKKPNSRTDEQHSEQYTSTRRKFIQNTILIPTAGMTSLNQRGHKELNADSLEALCVDDTVLPADFEPYTVSVPTPFAHTLIAADDRFTQNDIVVTSYIEGPDSLNPRYTVATMAVHLPEPDALTTVRTRFVEAFETMMADYDDLERTQWIREQKYLTHPHSISLHGLFQTSQDAVSDVEWLTSSLASQFGEHWGLCATDDSAVMTVVFGYRGGPWQPRTLFQHSTDHIRQQMQNHR